MATAHTGKKKTTQNRELSWLQFNRRVQAEADNPDNPLLERAKFLSIVTSNLDEFMQVRYHGVYEDAHGRRREGKNHEKAVKLYRKINKEILRQNNVQYILYEGLRSELYLEGVQLYPAFSLDAEDAAREKRLFEKDIRPYLKVEDFQESRRRQKQLYFCVKLTHGRKKDAQFKLIALPTALPRLFDISHDKDVQRLIRLEDVVRHNLPRLFPRDEVEHAAAFRILRNQDFPVQERTEEDVEPAVREMLGKRPDGRVMRLEAEECMSEEMLTLLMKAFQVERERRYRVTGPLDLNKMMMGLYGIVKRADLKYTPAAPVEIAELMGDDVFDQIDRQDWLMYHPYHSFAPVVHLMQRAAEDPTVRAIRQTLYRVSGNSPIVAALAQAAENGKDVTVLFEAHARFDEENNLYWGERLRRAGCHVLYGLPNLKVHSKITLFERVVDGQPRREVHLGTGNYHDGTAKLYTDFGLLTADETLTADAAAFFDILQGREGDMHQLVKAPDMLQPKLISLFEREAEHAKAGRPARIVAKMNSLCDPKIIRALKQAAQAGVEINLIVRGICCLIPEVPQKTENIHVRSIVGRHLEHARAFLFENGGDHEVYLSSADWMQRNLYKRVELMFPIKDEKLRQAVENVLDLQWNDTEKCSHRRSDGQYVLYRRGMGGLNAQETMLKDIQGVFEGKYLDHQDETMAE
ncbi:MAG: polyphosphate kinase 1 [Clostridiales bacterium]|nr:polyphosphate kinase 1 [Clostridiales bacterium]